MAKENISITIQSQNDNLKPLRVFGGVESEYASKVIRGLERL